MQGWHRNVYRRLYYRLFRHVYCQGVPGCLLPAAGTPRSCLKLPLLGNQMVTAAAASPQQKPLVLETAAEAAAPSPPSRPGGAYAAPTCRGPKGRGGKGLASTEGTAPPHLRLGPTSCLPAHHCHIHTTHPHLVLAPGLAERQPDLPKHHACTQSPTSCPLTWPRRAAARASRHQRRAPSAESTAYSRRRRSECGKVWTERQAHDTGKFPLGWEPGVQQSVGGWLGGRVQWQQASDKFPRTAPHSANHSVGRWLPIETRGA